jgi:oligopeptide/dipeptide ABC transporter ATP-binding protein
MPYTAGLLGAIPSLDGDDGELRPSKGAPPELINPPDGLPVHPRCPTPSRTCASSGATLNGHRRAGHVAACHRWARIGDAEDPTRSSAPRARSSDELLHPRGAQTAPKSTDDTSRDRSSTSRDLVKEFPVKSSGLLRRTVG